MGRKQTREKAMKLLYQIQIQRDDIKEQIERFWKSTIFLKMLTENIFWTW